MKIRNFIQKKKEILRISRYFSLNIKKENKQDQTLFGYEFSLYLNSFKDANIAEKALNHGSQVFYGHGIKSKTQFERLHEISTIDEINLDSTQIGCYVPSTTATTTNSHNSNYNNEETLENIKKSMNGRPLHFITTSLDNQTSNILEKSKIINSDSKTQTGVELDTTFLINSKSSNQIIEQLEQIKSNQLLDILVLSSNPFTNHLIHPLLSWGKSNNITTIANDIFRGHPRSPGLFLPASVSRQRNSNFQITQIDEAIKIFHQCLEACVKIEKNYVNNLPNKDPNEIEKLKPIFLGHTLANSQHQILYLEEWEYLKENQIEPKFEPAVKEFKKLNSETENLLTLYIPLRRNLIRSFETVLCVRQELLTIDTHNNSLLAVGQAVSNGKKLPLFYDQDPLHICVMKSWINTGFTHVLATGVDVFSSKWSNEMKISYTKDPVNDQQIANIYLNEVSKNIKNHLG